MNILDQIDRAERRGSRRGLFAGIILTLFCLAFYKALYWLFT